MCLCLFDDFIMIVAEQLYNDYTDINECTDGSSNCHHMCTNDDGSYHCSCERGFSLQSDGITCRGNDHANINMEFYSFPTITMVNNKKKTFI